MLFRGGLLDVDEWPFEVDVDGDGVWLPFLYPAEDGVVAELLLLWAGVERTAAEAPPSDSFLTSFDIWKAERVLKSFSLRIQNLDRPDTGLS